MGSSSSTSNSRAPRPIALWQVLLLLALFLVGAEIAVQRHFTPPGDIRNRVQNYLASAHKEKEILVMGSCLPEQIIDIPRLDESLGDDYRFHLLSTPTGTGLLWHVLLNTYIPEGAQVEAVLIPFGHADLTRRNMPWESQLMEVATWASVPDLMALDCQTFACRGEIFLSKLSRAYRYRNYLAGQLWKALGTGQLEKTSRDAQYIKHWQTVRPERSHPYLYLERVLALAQAKGIPLIFTPLPLRSHTQPGYQPSPGLKAEWAQRDSLIHQYGAKIYAFPAVEGLGPEHFEDDVHVNEAGRQLLTQALEAQLPHWLGQTAAD